jgi:hypothetical protein
MGAFSGCSWGNCGIPDYIEDRNGNQIVFGYGTNGFPLTLTDTTGRHLIISNFGSSSDSVTVPGQDSTYTVNWTGPSFSFSITVLGGTSPCDATSASGSLPFGATGTISQINLPNRKFYKFLYDSKYGLLSKIFYPTGGMFPTFGAPQLRPLMS